MAKEEVFMVQILDRQNTTWQGTITWTESGRKATFRSALELLKLVDSQYELQRSEEK